MITYPNGNTVKTSYDGCIYAGQQLLAIQDGTVRRVHQDPVAKSQRLTDVNGSVTAGVELDPWGGETSRSWNQAQQPRRFTTYERDANESDEAMMRRYNRWWSRFDQPDPYDGSYDLADPQSLNRYSYTQNDPVNFTERPAWAAGSGAAASAAGPAAACSATSGSRPKRAPTGRAAASRDSCRGRRRRRSLIIVNYLQTSSPGLRGTLKPSGDLCWD